MGLPGGSALLPSGGLVLDGSALELGQAKAGLSKLVENLPALVFVKNAQTLSFELFNGAAEQFLGAPRDAVIGRSDADFFPSDQVAFFAQNDRSVLHESKVLDIPREPIDTAQGRRWLHTRKIPVLDSKGGALYLLGISLEATRRRDAKGELRRLHAELEQRVGGLARAPSAFGTSSEPPQDPCAGDLKALHAKYGQAIFAHCKRLLGSSAAGEDAVQEVFVRVLRQTDSVPTAAELRPWLFRIATNYCLNELRNRRVRTRGPFNLVTALPNSLENCLLARGQLAQLFERLPPRVRDVARLTYLEGMLQQEVADALGISRRTVVSCLSQMRARRSRNSVR